MLIGISLGPGDPELLTIKAASALKSCSRVFVPGEMAAELARPYCRPEILQFPMIEDKEELQRIWSENACRVAEASASGCTGFACIGDVNTFSTFSHLERMIRERLSRELRSRPSPAWESSPALASRFAAPLESSFDGIRRLSHVDTVITHQGHPAQKRIAEELRAGGDLMQFMLGSNLCTCSREDHPRRDAGEKRLLLRAFSQAQENSDENEEAALRGSRTGRPGADYRQGQETAFRGRPGGLCRLPGQSLTSWKGL